ncbi:class I SAM-dependent methyltransferase [Methylovirgula sp. 4M-Z18]|uniref:class I SAM-dependent methyltransferase n=1 Tax=Methylovirgula sp. 4M-Z18 TaxID=2293567 RepID=UPI000E2F26F8|nr:class I SAM-dependent methyltransferase [Methylovirgula sp. 4M-Z18]RFB81015.1 class I SAM-dependent methyltransferase [Methylovirgula sp. 4M-Z18]
MEKTAFAIHQAAAHGFAQTAEQYARGRPDYPTGVGNWLRDRLGLGPGKIVVDLGAGTGKFTARQRETGAHVIAIEPVPEMRARLVTDFADVEARQGTATSIPLADNSADAIACAQAFHWFATKAALDEIHRVLKPGGKLGLVWNARDERVPWMAKLTEIVNAHEGDAPRYHTGAWKEAFPHDGFGQLHEEQFLHSHTGAPEDVILNRFMSVSFIAALPADEKAHVQAQIAAIIASEPDLAGHDVVDVRYRTNVYWTTKIG